ncbi:dihydrolipoamide dehydrogenase of glycine decarboxylase from pisum Sativum [Pavlovales sp. CCMP2436]|nr:dihydrolipoamide dehydrogenase of glycine decarboxylase from pisum Sativum [Pavlovales sp. CCMP2436]
MRGFGLAARQARAPLARVAARRMSSTPETVYDVVIVGGGPGGYPAAIKAGQLGLKVACIDMRGAPGGTCLNVGCIPSKALLHSSHIYEEAKHGFGPHGISADNVRIELDKLMEHKNKTVTGLTSGIEGLLKKYKVDYIKGKGKVLKAGEVGVTDMDGKDAGVIKTKNIVIATGSVPTPLPPVPIDEEAIVSSTGCLKLAKIPKTMIVIGAGVIGLEMGSVWRRLGAEVTVVEYLDRITPGLDSEIAKTFQRILTKQGMKFKMQTKVVRGERKGEGVSLTVESVKDGKQETLTADIVLVAIGRNAYTNGLGLEEAGVKMGPRGIVEVDERMQTNVPGIWAIGDVIRGAMLAHKAEEEGIAVIENIAGKHGHVNYKAIPGVIYTFPEVANVGMSEDEAKAAGIKYKIGKFPFMANSRARANALTDGLVKFVTEAETDKILGVHIIAHNAGEMIAEGVLGIEYGATAEDIARTCHAHPTMSEAFKEAAMAAYDKPIHF